MTKKIFTTLFVLAITLIFSSFVFANTTTDDMGSEMSSSWDKLSNTAQNMGNNVRGAIDNMGDTMTGNTDNNNTNNNTDNSNVNNATTGNTNNTNNNDDDLFADTNNGYTATRTATTTNTGLFGMDASTMWTWLILAILGVAIVALVWSYGKQTTNNTHTK